MKNRFFLGIALVALMSSYTLAEEFLGLPVPPGGSVLKSQEDRLEKAYTMGYDQLVRFYKNALKDYEYVKFWDRGDSTYIEDHLNRPWHSVTIEKTDKGATLVILEDNWTWIIGTLVIRFVGVFVVLFVLYIALSLSGAIISRLVDKPKKKAAA